MANDEVPDDKGPEYTKKIKKEGDTFALCSQMG